MTPAPFAPEPCSAWPLRLERLQAASALIAVLLALQGCEQSMLRGTVFNTRGEPLPGVAVRIRGSDLSALTNAMGKYQFPFSQGAEILLFDKTGYAPARLEHTSGAASMVNDAVALWRLPAREGVYLLEGSEYSPLTRDVPEQTLMQDGSLVYTAKRIPERTAEDGLPTIICYKTPRFDTRLTRLEPEEVRFGAGSQATFSVFRPAGTVNVDLSPLDPLKGLLLKVQIAQPLEAGHYAIHWGALDGFATLESRVFLFSVPPPKADSPPIELEFAEPAIEERNRGGDAPPPPGDEGAE